MVLALRHKEKRGLTVDNPPRVVMVHDLPVSVFPSAAQNALADRTGFYQQLRSGNRPHRAQPANPSRIHFDPWDNHRIGARGELSVPTAYGVPEFVPSIDRQGEVDLGVLEVRATRGDLFTVGPHRIRPFCIKVGRHDKPNLVYCGVVVRSNFVELLGWIYGYEARRQEWLEARQQREAAWFVPWTAARPLRSKADLDDMWVAACKIAGQPVDEPQTMLRQWSGHVPPELRDEMLGMAERRQVQWIL